MSASLRLSRRVVVAGIAGVLAAPRHVSLAQQTETPDRNGPIAGVVTSLIADAHGLLDQFGRVPLARITYEPGATSPDDLLAGPLVAVVESGEFTIQAQQTDLVLSPGDLVELPDRLRITAENTASTDATLLALPLNPPEEWGIELEEDPPTGLTFVLLAKSQNVRERQAPKRIFVDRVKLAPGATYQLTSPDAAEELDMIDVIPEIGSVVVRPDAEAPEHEVEAGDDFGFDRTAR